MKSELPWAVPTFDVILKLLTTKNPVTRAVLADIIGDRIDRAVLSKNTENTMNQEAKIEAVELTTAEQLALVQSELQGALTTIDALHHDLKVERKDYEVLMESADKLHGEIDNMYMRLNAADHNCALFKAVATKLLADEIEDNLLLQVGEPNTPEYTAETEKMFREAFGLELSADDGLPGLSESDFETPAAALGTESHELGDSMMQHGIDLAKEESTKVQGIPAGEVEEIHNVHPGDVPG
jgi:hypothetical protein